MPTSAPKPGAAAAADTNSSSSSSHKHDQGPHHRHDDDDVVVLPDSPDPLSPSRRRPRVDSESQPAAVSLKPQPKRFKISTDDLAMPPSLKAAGKARATAPSLLAHPQEQQQPQVVDLTRRTALPFATSRKLAIKNLQARPRTEQVDDYYRRTWDELTAALDAFVVSGRPAVPLERLYSGVEDVCRRGSEIQLYRLVQKKCEEHLSRSVLPALREDLDRWGEAKALASVLRHWKTWGEQTAMIRSTFSFLDRSYLLKQPTLLEINSLAIKLFKRTIFPKSASSADASPSIGALAISNLLDQIQFDRTGDERFDANLTRESVRMFHVMDVYLTHLEPAIVTRSQEYFERFGEGRSAASLRDYIHATQKLLYDEDLRCNAFNLDATTKTSLLEQARQILIDKYSAKLLDGGSLGKLLDEADVVSLRALYELLKVSGKQASLNAPFCEYILQRGGAIVGDKSRDQDMVMRLLEFRRALDLVVRDAFARDDAFHNGLRNAFGKFMNNEAVMASAWGDMGRDKVAEMIAKYIDMLLRGGIKAIPKSLLSDATDRAAAERSGQASSADEDAELDRQLDQALELFRHLGTKDTFEAFYKKDLARRLLMERSASQDAERNMLAKFRGECGANFTHNLEQMFKDQELARDEMATYRQTLDKLREDESETGRAGGRKQAPEIDLQVMILSAAAWPTYPAVEMRVPAEVARQLEHFDKHYRAKHTGRVLTWKHSLTHCMLTARFPRGKKELFVSAFQAAVLLLFNEVADDGVLSYADVSAATGLTGADLDRTLQSLACGRARVLTKHPKGKDVAPTDTFAVNRGFTDPKIRVKINQIQLRETTDENRATHARVAQDRRFETQAAVVRIMKSRKRMGHGELVAEVITMTRSRGSVDAQAIKREIETLIEKDYLEREDGGFYQYLA